MMHVNPSPGSFMRLTYNKTDMIFAIIVLNSELIIKKPQHPCGVGVHY
jgi:hypothetical protein